MPSVSIAFQTNKPIQIYGHLATGVENYGFEGISVYNDMLYQPAWLPLMEIARRTKHIRIGPAAVNPFTCHPVQIAGNLALLDELSGGRAYLGLARGAWLDFVGLAPEQPITALREAFACVRHLLSQYPESLPGEIFPLAGGDSLRWRILRTQVPFLLGSWGAKTVAACLPLISEVKLGGTANPGSVRWMRDVIAGAASNLRLESNDTSIVVGAVTVVDEDGEVARELGRREVSLYLPVIANLDPSITVEPEQLEGIRSAAGEYDFERAATYISDDLLRRFAFVGTPDEVAAQAAALFEAGASRVEFGTPHGLFPEEGLKLLGQRVLPALQEYRER